MDTIKLAIGAAILVLIGLAAWGVKHAVDVFQETAAENAALRLENKELATSLNEERRTSGILFVVAKSNTEVKNVIQSTVGAIQGDLRALANADPVVRDRAARPVPDVVQQRLQQWPTGPDGYPLRRPGAVPPSDAGAAGQQPN